MIYFSIIFWVSNSQILVRWTNLSAWRFLGNWGGWINGCAVAVGEESNCQLPPRWLEVKRTAKWGGCPPLLPFRVVRTVAAAAIETSDLHEWRPKSQIILAPFFRVCWIQHSRHSRFTYQPLHLRFPHQDLAASLCGPGRPGIREEKSNISPMIVDTKLHWARGFPMFITGISFNPWNISLGIY